MCPQGDPHSLLCSTLGRGLHETGIHYLPQEAGFMFLEANPCAQQTTEKGLELLCWAAAGFH